MAGNALQVGDATEANQLSDGGAGVSRVGILDAVAALDGSARSSMLEKWTRKMDEDGLPGAAGASGGSGERDEGRDGDDGGEHC